MTEASRRGDGVVASLQRSDGGVPKQAVDRARVGTLGMEGDRQANRKYHGGPDRALCLYSRERLDALVAEGHPIVAGSLGENVTVSGLDWGIVGPGTTLMLGEVEVEVTAFTVPCRQIARAFRDAEITRVSQQLHPGWSRVYVRVLREGMIVTGDPVAIGIVGAAEIHQ